MVINKTQNNFRLDINGLRAWAVISVIFFHFGVSGFTGGFIGVDIFFVISGFLMTGIIIKGLENNKPIKFSIINFYFARARRIIPALIILCATLIITGWFFLPASEYKSLGTHSISAIGFFSNILFFRESGYFDPDAHNKWLLHTWSLSVEWQFYIILPIVLTTIWKFRPGRVPIIIMIILGIIISQTISITLQPINQSLTFFMLPTRAWEMLVGGLVFLLSEKINPKIRVKKTLEAVGILLISTSIFLFDSTTLWPGWSAWVPVIGTALVILSFRKNSILTSNKVAQWTGSCSYSLYLWHWPIVVLLNFIDAKNSVTAIAIGITSTIILGKFSHFFIENHSNILLKKSFTKKNELIILIATTIVVILSLTIRLKDGVSGRLAPEIDKIFMEASDKNPRINECFVSGSKSVPECTYGGDTLGVIVMGDSHAQSMVRAIEKALTDKRLSVLDWTLASCPTIFNIQSTNFHDYQCSAFVNLAFEKQKKLPSQIPIILASRTSAYIFGPNGPGQNYNPTPNFYTTTPYSTRSPDYLKSFREDIINTACKFAEYRKVYLVRPIPEMQFDVPKKMGRSLILGHKKDVSILLSEYKIRQAFVWKAQDAAKEKCGIEILDPISYLCKDEQCSGSTEGLPIYYDDHHLNERGGEVLIPMFEKAVKNLTVLEPVVKYQK
ncbi:acyltransferase family protein [Pseudomonas agarici]|uniref:acyltransferase family protein n=1 Tax=Pseudomonas agarici TaxID=46677 RepID=UPI0015A32227|nr:acyltransferase family protein [Pseudomonas agarici]NWB91689.1 acyltransferase [Pseudomonas agarici]